MVFEYILKENGIDPASDLEINQSIDFGSTGAAFAENQGDFTVESAFLLHPWNIIFPSRIILIMPDAVYVLNVLSAMNAFSSDASQILHGRPSTHLSSQSLSPL